MHEFGLAENILKIAIETAEAHHAKKILIIGLKLGKMVSVENESLKMSFEILKADTIASEAELKINSIPIQAVCQNCGNFFELDQCKFFCPKCHGILTLKSGREFLVEFIDCE